jgi:poly-gamma-glutamate synthesis protein (capsule biosynthesis protein)
VALHLFLIQVRDSSSIVVAPVGNVYEVNEPTQLLPSETKSSEEVLFVGDILLARHVEHLMTVKGYEYPYKNLKKIFGDTPHIIGNFESAILKQHIKTPSFVTTFSVDKKFIPLLKDVGFTHLSLANNHSFDYGAETFLHTEFTLTEAGLVNFGHPQEIGKSSVVNFQSGDYTISILALNKVFVNPNPADVKTLLSQMASTSDYQIAFIHWGEEYELKHNQTQEVFAKLLIDAGIDAIIGHHPHVTQDIQVYNNKPIFYSLGNFIFDQYFSVDVQQGLALKLKLASSTAEFTLVPISSEGQLSQPYMMGGNELSLFLKNLSRRSDPSLMNNLLLGRVILPF